ncbi:LysR family transcriptional regulator [Nisaea acidiphila]|uniref:LysR family transcriptional regulator n=1 Tax=Nisaea acidiphila TaxID=1862145 RepID=A0A9J7AQ15_9PROT|nr:LysR family transcriptional regulator [Nisaea acidiphila]UUX49254.1 LysR family transcriptional regulator [Nisaea acidiphila]
MINARQLEVLCTVIEVGTTARAAELLNVSQPAVSNMIRHTEDLIGFPLFVRERGRLIPTREAQHIAQEAQYLFMQQKRVDDIISELRGGTIGRLNLIATPSLGHGILPRVIAEFVKNKPKLKLSVEFGSIDEINEHLVSGRADLAFSITQPRHSVLTVRPVAEGRMMCVCPKDHELAYSERVNVTDLNHVKHISYAAGTPLGQLIDPVFSKQGLERRYFCEVRHTATALEMALNGLGVTLVDSFALVGRDLTTLAIRPTSPTLRLNLFSITCNLFPTSNVALQFQSFFGEYLKQHDPAHTEV